MRSNRKRWSQDPAHPLLNAYLKLPWMSLVLEVEDYSVIYLLVTDLEQDCQGVLTYTYVYTYDFRSITFQVVTEGIKLIVAIHVSVLLI